MKKILLALVITVVVMFSNAQSIFVLENDTITNRYDSTLVILSKMHKGDCLYARVEGYENKSFKAENDTVVTWEYKLDTKDVRTINVAYKTNNQESFESTYYIANYRILYKGQIAYDYGCDCYTNQFLYRQNHISLTSCTDNDKNTDWFHHTPSK